MLPEPLVCTVVLMMYFIKWKNTSRQKDKINNSFAIFICVDPIWCGCGVKCAMPMYLLFVYLYFAAKLPNFKRNFLSHFCKKLPCFCAHMKAENLRIPKLSLLLHLGDSKPGLWAIKHDLAFFLRHPVSIYFILLGRHTCRHLTGTGKHFIRGQRVGHKYIQYWQFKFGH